jgi:hypothetical protein
VNATAEKTTERDPGSPWPLAEAAEFLNVCERTLTRAGELKKVRLIRFGRKIQVPDSEVRRLAEEGL